MDVNSIFGIKKEPAPSTFKILKQSVEQTEDYAVKKVVHTREGTIEKVPVNNNDITNKAYVDAQISGIVIPAETDPLSLHYQAWLYEDVANQKLVANNGRYNGSLSAQDLAVDGNAVISGQCLLNTNSTLYGANFRNHSTLNTGALLILDNSYVPQPAENANVGFLLINDNNNGNIALMGLRNYNLNPQWIESIYDATHGIWREFILVDLLTGDWTISSGIGSNSIRYINFFNQGTTSLGANFSIGTSPLNIKNLPTSPAGLNPGDVWVDRTGGLNILKIV